MGALPSLNLAETLTISVGSSRKDTVWQQKKLTWPQLVERLRTPLVTDETVKEFADMTRDQQANIKDVGGFVGGELKNGSRAVNNVLSRDVIAWDADYADRGIWEMWDMQVGCAAVVHSTHKHTPEHPRLRLIAPLKRPVTPMEYEAVGRKVASWLGIESFDDTTYEVNRLMFWPSRSRDGEYVFDVCEGPWLDPDIILAEYNNWQDMSEWPVSKREDKLIRKAAEKQGDPLTKPGIIGAFNRAYTISDAITTFLTDVYTPCEYDDRWTYNGGTTSAGAKEFDGGIFLYSWHDHDPVHKRLCNAFDLVRLHKFGDMDKGVQADLADLPSQKAMREFCKNDQKVIAELATSMRQDPSEVFKSENDDLIRYKDDTTVLGSAEQFIDTYGHKIRYCGEFNWMFWNGQKWATDAAPEVSMLAHDFSDKVLGQAKIMESTAGDKYSKEAAKAEMQRAKKLRTSAGRKDMMEQASIVQYEHDVKSYDANPWDLNTPDGIVDLKTGQLRDHDPEAKCTKITACGLKSTPEGVKMWDDFIRYITSGDVEFARYLQMVMGMAAVGKVYEEGIVISYGPGGNGKSTFFGAISKVMGDYAKTLNADTIAPATGKPDENYIVLLRGVRLGIMGETDENAKLAIAGMKRITSQDDITARQIYKDPLQFEPTATLFMHTNHLPRLNSLDGGTKRRLAVMPFPATLPPEEVITDYKSKLVENAGEAILQWIVDGAIKFYNAECKLNKPDAVAKATDEYIRSEDTIQQFIDDECLTGEDYSVSAGYIYTKYVLWAEQNGYHPKNQNAFGRALTSKGYTKTRTDNNTKRAWGGLTHNSIETD